VLEKLVNNQLTGFLYVYSILSGFRSGYGCVTATLKVLNDVTISLGSILSPTLFSIYINNIAQAVGSSLMHLYADDTVLYSAGPSLHFVVKTLYNKAFFVSNKLSLPCGLVRRITLSPQV
jgi:hypothetical protein